MNIRALGAYLFVLILVYLAGIYVGRFYYFIYVFMVVLPVYSIAQVLVSSLTLNLIQAVDAENPAKGDIITFRLWITGRPMLTTGATVRFTSLLDRLPARLPELHLALSGRRFVEKSFELPLRHRGTYTVGIESVEIVDPVGWLSVRKEGSSRSFVVRPRILPLRPPLAETWVHALSESGVDGVEEDLTMFEHLVGYRAGDPIKHIAWKKFLTTGTPFLKQFGGSSEPAVIIYLDLRLPNGFGESSELALTTEDCSVEMLIALVKGYLDRGVRVTVRACGEEIYTFTGAGPRDFPEFFHQSDSLRFSPAGRSPCRLYDSDRLERPIEGPILLVSHRLDEELFEIASDRTRMGGRTGIFLNLTALNGVEREVASAHGRRLASGGSALFRTADEPTLPADLRQWEQSRR